MRNRLLINNILILWLLINGCKPTGSNPIDQPNLNTLETRETYPGIIESVQPQQLVDSIPLPNPELKKGALLGILVQQNGEPYIAPAIYLGRIIEAQQEGYSSIVSLSVDTAPQAIQNKEGKFLFDNISPGTYALVIWTPISQTVLPDPINNDIFLEIEIVENQIKDLGKIIVP